MRRLTNGIAFAALLIAWCSSPPLSLAEDRLDSLIILHGNVSALTATQIRALATDLARTGPYQQDQYIDAAAEVLGSPLISQAAFEPVMRLTKKLATATGQPPRRAANDLCFDLRRGDRGVDLLNRRYNFLDVSKRIKISQLYGSGRSVEALRLTVSELQARWASLPD